MTETGLLKKLETAISVRARLQNSLELVGKTERVGAKDAIAMFDFFFHKHIKDEAELRKLLAAMRKKLTDDIEAVSNEITELENKLNVAKTLN